LLNTTSWSDVGRSMCRQVSGGFYVGGRATNRSFKGDVASMVVTTLKRGQLVPGDDEISMMVRDPKKWIDDYKVGESYRLPNSESNSNNFQKNTNGAGWSTKVWIMGDGPNDSYSNMMRNQVYINDQNYSMLRLINMQSTDIVGASIAGITNNANVVAFSGDNYSFGSNYYDGYVIDITSTGDWTAILPQLSSVPTDYTITFRNITDVSYSGALVPYGSETIDGSNADKSVAGKVDITIKKQNSTNWEVVEVVQYENFLQESSSDGSTTTVNHTYNGQIVNRVFDFTSSDTIELNHNIGGIPIIQVWVADGSGGYTDADVDIDHDWSTMLSSTINLGQVESGKVVYVYNQ